MRDVKRKQHVSVIWWRDEFFVGEHAERVSERIFWGCFQTPEGECGGMSALLCLFGLFFLEIIVSYKRCECLGWHGRAFTD